MKTFTLAEVGNAGTQMDFAFAGDRSRRFSISRIGEEIKFARRVGIDSAWFAECVRAGAGTYPVNREIRPDVFRVRSRTSQEFREFPSFVDALTPGELPSFEPLIQWRRTDAVAALDCDVPRGLPPIPHNDLAGFLATLSPRPDFAWITHGGGLRLIFSCADDFSSAADELAAVAFLSVRDRWPAMRIEIKHETRHPGGERNGQRCGSVIRGHGTGVDLSTLAARLANTEAAETAIDAWLYSRGLERGRRYSHAHCVIAPSDKGGRDPVWVNNDGVYCHYCATTSGHSFRGFATLCGDRTASVLGLMARNWVHWGHARYTCEALLGLPEFAARLCYRAAMKLLHPEDADRVNRVFDRDLHFTRVEGFWTTGTGGGVDKGLTEIIKTLPAATSDARAAELIQTSSIEHLGYLAIDPIWGCRIASIHPDIAAEQSTRPTVVRFPEYLRSEFVASLRPRYEPASSRRSIRDAWATIRRAYPGVNRKYLMLLIAAKGCVEAENSLPPIILATGCSGAGKTSHVHIAASICGDSATEFEWDRSAESRMQCVAAAQERGGYAVVNEVFKLGRESRRSAVDTLNFLLTVSPGLLYRKLYVGRVALGRLPVFVLTDTTIPDDAAQDPQIARRVVTVDLTSVVQWVESIGDAGIKRPALTRIGSEEFAAACNTILSHVTDRFFRERLTFTQIAARLGFPTLESKMQPEITRRVRAFFAAWQAASDSGDGWREVNFASATDPLATAWLDVADEDGQRESRFLSSQDWTRHGFEHGTKFEKRGGANGSALAIRFRHDGTGRVQAPANKLDAEPANIHRHGNAIGGGYSTARIVEIPCQPDDASDVASGPVQRANDSMGAGWTLPAGLQAIDTAGDSVPF